eukprot:3466390-Rhodomonas_salina.1
MVMRQDRWHVMPLYLLCKLGSTKAGSGESTFESRTPGSSGVFACVESQAQYIVSPLAYSSRSHTIAGHVTRHVTWVGS